MRPCFRPRWVCTEERFAFGFPGPHALFCFSLQDTSWFRPLAGFVTSGDYSLARGATAGRAAVLACSLRAAAARVRAVLAAQSKLQATGLEVPILLLSRLPDSRQYRFAVCSLANNWA